MQRIYLDNAATTPLDPVVLEAMMPYISTFFGNPSSIHSHGREARAAIEKSRKTVANLLNTSPSQIFFTSAGTEADNMALAGAVSKLEIRHVITARTEHHAVLHTLQHLENIGKIHIHYTALKSDGGIDLYHLEELLINHPHALVSLMHGNNEIGNMIDLHTVGLICRDHKAIFHSDTVQTIGHYKHDLQVLPVDFIVGSAHKFHGPKGVGFIYLGHDVSLPPLLHGGAQERNMRGGTENVSGIVGLAKALELAYHHRDEDILHIRNLKQRLKNGLLQNVKDIKFNGNSGAEEGTLHHVLNVSFPVTEIAEMLLFNLDIMGISVSGGSACNSGANIGSHVLNALYGEDERPAIRFSFSKFNTIAEIEFVIAQISKLFLQS